MTRSNPLNRKTTTLGVRLLSAGALLATTLVAGGSDMFAPASVSSALPGAFGEAASRGDVQVVPSYGALRPTEGDSAVLITTREQDGDRPGRARVSSLSFDGFSIPADTGTLRIDYNFLTNERLRSKSVDHFSVVLLQPSTGGEIELLRLASDAQLQAVPGAPFMRQSGFRSLVADVSQYAGALEQFSLVLRVVDRGRADAPSGLFIDNIRFEPPGAPLADSSVEHVAVNRGEAVSLDGSVSADPNGAIVDYFWTFGDGSTASGAVVSHRYMNAGTYQATLTVTDADGNTSTDTFQVTARGGNAAPAIVSSPNTGATENLPYVYQVLADDPDVGDTLTYSLTQAPAGMTIDANSGLISWTPAPGVAARSDVTVEVEDTGLLTDTQSFTVVIGPEFYVIAVDDSARLFEATAYSNGTFSTLDQIGDNGSNNRGGPAIADFDGDGDFDMVSGNGANPSMNLWYWERDEGRFMPPAYLGQIGDTLATAGGRAMDSAVADFNNDGRMDFAINGESTNSWLFLNNGNFTFGAEDFFSSDFEIDNSGWASQTCSTAAPQRDDTTSASGDWSLRVEASNDNSCLSVDINPSSWDVFDAPIVELSYRIPAGTPVGLDVNVSGFGRVFVAGTASALPGTYLPVDPITLIDDDQWHTVTIDLYNRVLVASPSSTAITELEWYTANNAPDGSQFWFDDVRGYRRTVETGFTSSLLPDTGATGRGLDALDVNNDGNADIVRAINNGTVSLYLGDGAGNFTTSVAGDPGNDPYALALGDFDSDELVDFFAMNSSSGDAYFFKGNGDGTFQAGVLTPSLDTNNLGAYASFDFNLDGNLDMAVVDWTSDNLWYYPGNGDATFGERVQIGNIPGNVLGVSAPAGRVLGQPTAQGDLDQDVINENGTVNFDGGTSTDDGTIVSWDWDFGDGNTASGQNVSNTFTDEGVYTVVLTVTDEDGQTDRRAFVVTVLGDFPVSDPGGPYTVTEASASNGNWSLIVDGSASSDSDTSIAEYQWDLDSSDGIQIDATGAMALLNYNAAGVYTVTLTVFDEVGQSTSATTTVTVEAGALPVAGLTGPGVVDETTASLGEYAATYDLSSSSDDVGITNFEIDWGDGDTTQINAITDNFNDGDFTNGQEWTQSSSSVWEVVDGQLHYPETVGAWRWLQVLNQSYSDFQLEVDFMATDTGRDGYLGISFHGSPTSANTNTFLMYSRNSWDFWRFYDWRTSTTLVDEGDGWDPGIWYHLRLVVIGNRMQLYVTPEGGVETLQAEAVDPSHRNGVIGLLSFDQVLTYDNVKVTPINEGLRPTHLYDTPGDYPVTLTVTDNAGQTDTAVVNTTVTPNDPPAADAGGPYVLTEADAVNGIWTLQVDASNSTDDVNVQRYEYDFGDGNSHTTGFAQGFSGSYFATGTDLYGFGIPDASVGRVIAIEDGTFVELIDLETDAVIATRSLNRFQTWNSVDTDGLYFKLRSNKPVAAYLTDFADHAAFMPSVGNSPVGREFISYHDINDGFYIYAFEDAVVRIFDTSGNLDAEATLEAGSYWEPSTALISGQVYRVLASGNIAMQTHGNDSYTTVPSSTGAAAGQLFYFATPSGASGSFAAFAYDAADVNVFDLDTDELLYTNSLAAGDTWFETGLTQRRLRVESTGDIEVWGGAVESQTTIEWLGDDTSFTTGRNGTEFYLHNLTDGIAIFAPNNDTQINIDAGDIVTTLNRDDFLALAPEDFPSGSGTHMITSSQPIIIQTLGATTGFNSEGTYLGGLAARHGYAATGTYTLTVTAIDNAGQQTQATTTVEVTVGDPPVPVIDAPAVVDENSANNGVWTVDFDASGSTDDFGIFSYEWDFGDGNTGTGVTTSHGYTAPGVYTVTLTVTDLGGQQTVTTMMITVTGNNGPMADAGGPYVYGEEAASFGQWTATLDGTGSTDDVGLNTYVWTFDPELDDDFAGTVLDTGTWTGTDDVTQNDSITVIGTGSWGNRYLVSNENFGRGGGLVFEAQVRRVNPSGSATAMFGLKNAGNTNFSFSELIYGIYFNATSVQVYEDGSNRGTFATLVPETLYDLRITAKPFQGALYEMREAGTAEWMVLYESEHSIESGLRHHTVVNRGEFEIDNARITAQEVGPVVNRSFDTPGTYGATLTVTDNALQANSDSTTITFTPGDAPVADAGGPYTVEVGALLNFNGTGSSDDNAIQQYEWLFGDTTGGPADANLPYSGRGPTPRHFYHATGTYQAELTTLDNGLQSDTAMATVNVIVGDAPTAVGSAVVTGAAGGPPVYFSAAASDDDFAIVDYRWDFNIEADSDGDGDPGNDIDGVGIAPFHVYDLASDVAGTLFSEPFDGTAIDSNTWLTSGATQDGAMTVTGAGSWGNRYVFSQDDYARGRRSFRGQVTVADGAGSEFVMWGLKNTNTNYSFNQMPHAIYFNNGSINIYELGSNRGVVGAYSTDVQYDVRIDTTATSANYFIRETGAPDWTQLSGFTPLVRTESPLKIGATVNAGVITFDNFEVINLGPYQVRLTVEDGAGQTSSTTFDAAVTDNLPPNVITVPWVSFDPLAPHETYNGKAIHLKGIVRDADAETYQWDFGDGTQSDVMPVTNTFVLEAVHTYPAAPAGTPFVAVLRVWDSLGQEGSATYNVVVKPQTLNTEINVAIDEGLWYLHREMTRNTIGTFPAGNWTDDAAPSATASSLQAFQINGHLESSDNRTNPYAETVQRGFKYLFTQIGRVDIATQTFGEPDTNGNGFGIQVSGSGGQPIYQGGQVMDAIASSSTPTRVAHTGSDDVNGRNYFDILTDMSDQYAWGQTEQGSGGGWRYSWNSQIDNSAAQWGAIGLQAAEDIFGIEVPPWVKERNLVWLDTSYTGVGWGYTTGGITKAGTPSGLVQLAFDDIRTDDPRWLSAEAWIEQNWDNQYLTGGDNKGYYAFYAFTKAMRLALPEQIVNMQAGGFDWFNDDARGLARTLVNDQLPDGVFPGTEWVRGELRSAWAIIMLSRTLFVQPPVADAGRDRVWAVDLPLEFDGSGSFHLDPFRSIVEYEWDFDGDGIFDTSSADPFGTFTYTSDDYPDLPVTITATLRVTDNNVPPISDTDTVEVIVAIPPHPPVAEVGGPYTCTAGVPCPLDGSGSFDIDPTDFIFSYGWELDGIFPFDFDEASGANPEPIFPVVGNFNIGLQVFDNGVLNDLDMDGEVDENERLSDQEFTTVNVVENLQPSADANGPYVVDEGSTVVLDASGSSDPNGDALSYAWDLDDDGAFDDALGAMPSYTGIDDGVYPVTVEISDTLLTDTAASTVTVNNVAPTVDAGPDQVINEGQTTNFLGAFVDPGVQDTHTIEWTFGDGNSSSGDLSTSNTFLDDGIYTVTLTVTDDDGGVGSDTLTVTVNNLPPVVDAGPDQVVNEGDTVNFNGAFVDPGALDFHTIQWDFGDGNTVNGTLTPSNTYVENGVYTVTLTVTDNGEGFGTDTLEVVVNNLPPVVDAGANQVANTGETVSLDPATFTDAGIEDTHIASIDWGDGTVEPGAVTQGAGSGSVDADHAYTLEGNYTVTVTVTDDDGGVGTDTFMVSIGQAELPPEADAGGPYVVDEGSSVTLDASNSSDPNGDALTYAWDLDNDGQFDDAVGAMPDFAGIDDGVYPVSVQVSDGGLTDVASTTVTVNNVDPIVEAGANQAANTGDTVSLDPASFTDAGIEDTHIASIDWGDGTIEPGAVTQGAGSGTVAGDHVYTDEGTYTVTVTVTDDDGGVGSDTFTVNVGQAELPPEADAGGPYVVDEGSSVTLDASNSTDPNGDALTYAWDLDNDGQFDDAVGAMPDFAGIDDGVYTVSVQVSDGGLTDVASTTVTVNNVDPIVEAGANQAANTGDTVSLDPASFTDAGIEDTHIASIDWGDGTVEPGAVTQGAGSGTVDGSHVYTDEGTYTVTVTVTDDDGGVGTDTFTVSIGQAALPPEADAGGPYVVDEGSSVTLDASNSSDPNGDALTYAWDLDNDGQFDDAVGATPDFDGIDDGVYTVSVQVSDGGLTDVASTTVTVNNVDPIVEAGNNQAAEVGDTVTLDPASFTDAGVLDTHIASIDWGDGTVDPGAVTQGAGNGTVNGKHVYTQPGTYTVTVTVTDDDGGVGSDTFLVEIDQPPVQTVFDLRARPKVKKVQLNWTPVQARAGQRTVTYNIYRSSTSGGPYTQIAAGHSNDLGIYIDFEVALGETYYYVITSVVGDNESLFSNEAGATLAPRP